MILIKNSQRKISVDVTKIKKDAEKLLSFLGYKDFDLGILLTTNQTIRKFNKQYCKKDKATDILSFPYHTDLKAGQKIQSKTPEDKNLGDIIISLESAQNDAKELARSLSGHLRILLVHGFAHLLGYDHETEKDFELMNKFEQKLLKIIATSKAD